MADSFIQLPADSTGKKLNTRERTVGANTIHEQVVIPTTYEVITYRGRVGSFRTPGRAGTAGQRLSTLYNSAGSAVIVNVETIAVDLYQTVVKAVGTAPPIIRISRFTTAPTNGTVLSKVATDTAQSSSANVELRGDASADGTSSASALTVTVAAGNLMTQEYAPRLITAAGYEMADRVHFFHQDSVYLRAGQGLVVHLDYTATGQNPITDMWTVTWQWDEFTLP